MKANHTYEWVINNCPPPKYESLFFPYADVFKQAYGYECKRAGYIIRKDLEEHIYDLCRNQQIACQIGVKDNGVRGIRLMSIK